MNLIFEKCQIINNMNYFRKIAGNILHLLITTVICRSTDLFSQCLMNIGFILKNF